MNHKIHLLSEKDLPSYWFKKLLDYFLFRLNLTSEFYIVDNEELTPHDKHCIVIYDEAVDEHNVYNRMSHNFEYKVFKVHIICSYNVDKTNDNFKHLAESLASTLRLYLSLRDFPEFYIQQVHNTSTIRKMGVDENGNAMYVMRYRFIFNKPMENTIVPL